MSQLTIPFSILKLATSLCLVLIASYSFAQNTLLPLDKDKNVVYTDRGTLPLTKAEIYAKAQNWVTHQFGNYQNAVVKDEPQNGLLVVSSYVPIPLSQYQYLGFELTLIFNEGGYSASLARPDGISQIRTPVRFSYKHNDAIAAQEMVIKTENDRKKRSVAEKELQSLNVDNEAVNQAAYGLLGKLKEFMVANP